MALSLFAACGETPDETTKAPETTTTPSTTAAPVTTVPDTSTAPDTTKAPDTTDTTAPETTTTPETDPEPLEPTLAADASHAEHVWFTNPSFTAYEVKQADGTIGYIATHCRYDGCDAIKDGKIRPVLVNMDFENYNGKLADYANESENVCAHKKGAQHSPGTVADGFCLITNKSQTIISTDFVWEYGKEYYISMDFQLNTYLNATKMSHVLTFGKGSMSQAARYFVGVGYKPEEQKWYMTHNFDGAYALEGISMELGKWYRLEYVVVMAHESANVYESPASTEERPVHITGGTTTMFLTPMHRNLDGEMVAVGEKIFLGTFDGIAAMYDGETRTMLDMDLDYIKFDSAGACRAVDNVVVGLAEKDK